jgi:hypothetical protein
MGKLTCTFAASYAGRQPLPGTVSAAVDLAGVLIPITLDSAPVPYDFSGADIVETGAFGTASNFFELGTGIIQPYGVYGEQPPPDMKLEDSREFNFIAVFGNIPSSRCSDQQYKVRPPGVIVYCVWVISLHVRASKTGAVVLLVNRAHAPALRLTKLMHKQSCGVFRIVKQTQRCPLSFSVYLATVCDPSHVAVAGREHG